MDRKTRKSLIVDLAALAIYLVSANPALTDVPAHEWVGIGVFVVFFVHMVQHVDWVSETVRSMFNHPSAGRIGYFVLDVLILVSFVTCTVSGVLISGTVLRTFGLFADGYFFWDPLHAASAKVLLALLIVHLALHWRWIVRHLKRRKPEE